jgi:hypothetical protein
VLQATTAPPTETARARASRIRLNMMSGSSVARRAPPLRELREWQRQGRLPGWPRGWPGRPRGQKVASASERTPVQMATDRCRLLAGAGDPRHGRTRPMTGDAGTHRRGA